MQKSSIAKFVCVDRLSHHRRLPAHLRRHKQIHIYWRNRHLHRNWQINWSQMFQLLRWRQCQFYTRPPTAVGAWALQSAIMHCGPKFHPQIFQKMWVMVIFQTIWLMGSRDQLLWTMGQFQLDTRLTVRFSKMGPMTLRKIRWHMNSTGETYSRSVVTFQQVVMYHRSVVTYHTTFIMYGLM